MIAEIALAVSMQLAATLPTDTGRLSGDRLVVEPLGFSFEVPPLWLGKPGPSTVSFCDAHPSGSIGDRILTQRTSFARLLSPRGEMKKDYAAVVDSVMPFVTLVAHLGGDPWEGTCGAPQMRLYVRERIAPSVRTLVPRGVQAAERAFPPVARADVDSAGWEITRLTWSGWYHDYSFTAQVEFWSVVVRDRVVTLVFMYIPYVDHHRAMLAALRQSVRY